MVLVASKPKRSTPPVHHLKRTGQHHKSSKHYGKAYWPYLPLLVIVVLGITFSSWLSHAQRNVLGYATEMSATALLNGTNSQRSSNGLGALALNGQLNAAAQAKANDMAARDYWSHNTPDGATPWTFIVHAGYSYQAAGENLAYGFGNSSETISGWMNSPEHRANILNGNYADVGFGIANTASYQGTGPETIVVAMYGKPTAAAAPTSSAAPVAVQPTTKPAAAAPATVPADQQAPAATPAAPTAQAQPTQQTPARPADTQASAASPAPLREQRVSRIQLVSSTAAPWSAFAISALAAGCIALFFLRHGLMWHRVLRKGEKFALKYHVLDIVLVALGVMGFVLTRTVGIIH
jgi:uncharacterized protein YkwD